MSKDTRLVYSTATGRVREPAAKQAIAPASDGWIRLRLETSGRNGKPVTSISGVPHEQLDDLARALKARCASGGSVKDACILIQGDHRALIKTELEKREFKVK